MLVFVYGTLRRGERGHHVLGGAPFVREAVTEPAYTMVDLGEYPALLAGGRTAIVGELYRVNGTILSVLDDYEDVPEMYQRVTIEVAGVAAELYLLPTHLAGNAPVIVSGDWLRR